MFGGLLWKVQSGGVTLAESGDNEVESERGREGGNWGGWMISVSGSSE